MTRTPARQRWLSARALIIAGAALALVATAVVISFNRSSPVSGKAPVIAATGRSDASAVLERPCLAVRHLHGRGDAGL